MPTNSDPTIDGSWSGNPHTRTHLPSRKAHDELLESGQPFLLCRLPDPCVTSKLAKLLAGANMHNFVERSMPIGSESEEHAALVSLRTISLAHLTRRPVCDTHVKAKSTSRIRTTFPASLAAYFGCMAIARVHLVRHNIGNKAESILHSCLGIPCSRSQRSSRCLSKVTRTTNTF